jgi:hypothetical protein
MSDFACLIYLTGIYPVCRAAHWLYKLMSAQISNISFLLVGGEGDDKVCYVGVIERGLKLYSPALLLAIQGRGGVELKVAERVRIYCPLRFTNKSRCLGIFAIDGLPVRRVDESETTIDRPNRI